MLKYSHLLQRPAFSLANKSSHSHFYIRPEEPSRAAGQRDHSARPSGPSVCQHRTVPAAPALPQGPGRVQRGGQSPSHHRPPRNSSNYISQEFCTRISFLPSASFPGWPASPSLHGGESILGGRLPCLLGRCDFVLQDTKSINESSLYCNIH